MTIDEAIAYEREKAKEQRYYAYFEKNTLMYRSCVECAEEHEQLAEWLEELKMYKSLTPSQLVSEKQRNDRAMEYSKGFSFGHKTGYNKAIDDFVKKISLEISESIIWGILVDSHKDNIFNDESDKIVDYVINTANEIAEQLKAGGENG